ncbi:MAG: hypothetical protein CVV13_09480 [Gammaproteobacteria bacterium HGW-Gammaproteobacteria-3]|nr:MAG: hypothetical protein CVV13_09480 [Gammaproteobacteria bacterium HGW-Gammaproteobacteria-3]
MFDAYKEVSGRLRREQTVESKARKLERSPIYVTVFAKLLLTPLTYIPVGNAAIGQNSELAYQQMWPREV